MKKQALWVSIMLLLGFSACEQNKPAVKQGPKEDPQVTAIKAQIAKTTPEGQTIIQKALTMKPVVNDQISGKTLGEVVDDYTKNKGPYNATSIGWEAAKKSNGRWKVIFHFKNYQKDLVVAEWEYNPEANTLYPFDLKNAPQFWTQDTGAAPGGANPAAAKKK